MNSKGRWPLRLKIDAVILKYTYYYFKATEEVIACFVRAVHDDLHGEIKIKERNKFQKFIVFSISSEINLTERAKKGKFQNSKFLIFFFQFFMKFLAAHFPPCNDDSCCTIIFFHAN